MSAYKLQDGGGARSKEQNNKVDPLTGSKFHLNSTRFGLKAFHQMANRRFLYLND
jgi:hypothetical protein